MYRSRQQLLCFFSSFFFFLTFADLIIISTIKSLSHSNKNVVLVVPTVEHSSLFSSSLEYLLLALIIRETVPSQTSNFQILDFG